MMIAARRETVMGVKTDSAAVFMPPRIVVGPRVSVVGDGGLAEESLVGVEGSKEEGGRSDASGGGGSW